MGRYTGIVLSNMGCQFTALNEGVDMIHKNNDMLAILKNVMDEWYAKGISRRVRSS